MIVVVEPDGLPDIVRGCLNPAQAAERYRLLRYAMRRLGALPGARVYLDAGNPGMFADPAQLAGPLQAAGVGYGRGFSANVSNFQWTADVVAWSQRLERDLGGRARAVIDTSRNGHGPYTGPDAPQWCNPPGRALGPAPRLDPGPPGIDAYLWVKDPGASDGACNGGPRGRPRLGAVRAGAGEAGRGLVRQHRIRVTRRGIQVTLGLLWILDGMLQLQPAMLTPRFATQVIAPAGEGQPAFVAGQCRRRPASSATSQWWPTWPSP